MAKTSRPIKRFDWRKEYHRMNSRPPVGAFIAMAEAEAVLSQEHDTIRTQIARAEVCPEHYLIATLEGYCPSCGMNLRHSLTCA
jgi:hypothetical protein